MEIQAFIDGWTAHLDQVSPCLLTGIFYVPIPDSSVYQGKARKNSEKVPLGGSDTIKKIHWVDWNSMCNLKANGGLGVMDVDIKNRALLYKWFWRYGDEPNALWRAIIDSKYRGATLTLFLPTGIRGGSLESGGIFLSFYAIKTLI